MIFFFAWIDESETFNPSVHARQDEDIFDLIITKQEGLFPTAAITVHQLTQKNCKPFAFISYRLHGKIHLLFKGRLVRFPITFKEETVTFELIAEPSEADKQLKVLARTMQQFPYYDPLFLSSDRRLDPDVHELLDARDDLLYWPRTMANVKLTNIFQGRYTLDLAGRFIYDSLTVQLVDAPLKQIDVELKIQWRQRFRGEASLDHLIHAALPDGMISTLTGADLEARWWRDGDAIGRSGYHLSHSALQKVDISYPAQSKSSASFWLSPHDPLVKHKSDQKPQRIRLKKNWYRPQLKVYWRYCQKRVEKVFFTLKNDVQTLGYHAHRKRTLRLHLHDIVACEQYLDWQANRLHFRGEKVVQSRRLFLCLRTHRASDAFANDAVNWQDEGPYHVQGSAEMRGTFFATDRGANAVEHAIEIARAHLAASTRAVEINVTCDLKEALSLTCDHMLTIEDERLPGKRVTGKVKKLVFEISGETGCAIASITLGCSLGTGRKNKTHLANKSIFAEHYFASNVMQEDRYYQTISGVTYQSFFDQLPERGHVYPAFLSARDILRGVTLTNNAEEQAMYLQQHQYPQSHNLKQSLHQVRTSVKLWFEDLRSVGALEHHIQVHLPQPWAAPKHIILN